MNEKPSIRQQLIAILVLPFMVAVIIPAGLYFLVKGQLFSLTTKTQLSMGYLFLVMGCFLFMQSLRLFIKIGNGTLAPWQPTQKLVVKSLYQYTRNPMILGVLFIVFAEALLLNSLAILIWAVLFFLSNTVYFIKKEEPDLEKRFGEEYIRYKKNVPRWFPRLSPWKPE